MEQCPNGIKKQMELHPNMEPLRGYIFLFILFILHIHRFHIILSIDDFKPMCIYECFTVIYCKAHIVNISKVSA